MTTLKAGDKAPNFSLETDTGETLSLSDFQGKTVILYFYPKDSTPGCTKESCEFRDNLAQFNRANAIVLGISKDSVKSHQKFKDKHQLSFPLLADEDAKVCIAYNTLVDKSMFGKKYKGIERSTFLIDPRGIIQKIWRKVKVSGHVEAVLAEAKNT